MKYPEWKALSDAERKEIGWHRHPRIKTVTLFTIALAVTFIIVVLGINKNSIVHLNRKPTAQEAFNIAKEFVKDRLKQPATAAFPNNSFKPAIDTATNSYQIQSSVKAISASGKMVRSDWVISMQYTGGDWSEKNSWQVESVNLSPEN